MRLNSILMVSEIQIEKDHKIRFSKETRDRAFERAGYRCELCPPEKNRRRRKGLTLHHVQIWAHNIRKYNIPPDFTDCPENVLVLCQSCHTELHREKPLQPVNELITGITIIGVLTERPGHADLMIMGIRMRH